MQVQVPSFAKINLDLRVLHKCADNYHELRTIFQTISLKDDLRIEFDRARRTELILDSSIDIADNLVLRAAKVALEHIKVHARVRFELKKKIPMGAGLGGGSSNAAAVLIALPALAGKPIALPALVQLAESLGSDVPFFLFGGAALGIGRGTELYPLPDLPSTPAVVVTSPIHVSTPAAYRDLNRVTNSLTSTAKSPILGEFQTVAWKFGNARLDRLPLKNDFEEAVFGVHPELAATARKPRRLGAKPALMTGSGSALFGVFQTAAQAKATVSAFAPGIAHQVQFVSRRRYQEIWRRSLGPSAGSSCFAASRGD